MTADPGRLARIHGESFTVPRPWTAVEIAGLLATPGAFLIEAPDGFLIGRALAGEAELLTLAVAPSARRRGTGAALVAGFLDRAATAGAGRAFLEVSADNAAARALYAQAGFAEAGRRPGYYRRPDGGATDALLLARALGPAPLAEPRQTA
ncbi:MAG: GNAT family N-acetyltransferase [Rhodobacteraceae bacterium]|jgi:ribosomal-protein-alanine N-acetyltransferase|uniref:GNAT family N-acetyltransferase n=1 Tax=Albidovulum sp. TaxID=1872424 RepID=UPI001D5B0C68|nr:GNAT family N-acetyltransferase [uncultured Defluviimonas sp.]MCB2127322.1 GNAT family N-acetyltransferase [Paracoccaceae bacterium]MCC0069217.1 GNAT family N-acetyltransferase [Paracoccaceae bacterium]